MAVWEPRAKSEVEQGSVGKTGVYMSTAAFCGEREWAEEVQSGMWEVHNWDRLEAVGRTGYSGWVGTLEEK